MTVPRRMRLLLVAQPVDAGVPRHVIDLLPFVLDAGWDVTVACPRASLLWEEAARRGLRRVTIGAAATPRPRDALDIIRLARLARRADVVHAHSSKAGLLTRVAATIVGRRRRCAYTPHGWSFWAVDGIVRRVVVWVERVAAKGCARIITVSAHERDAALDIGVGAPEQYRVIPNGVDADRFAAEPDPATERIVMVARLSVQKRPELAVAALAELRRDSPGATLDLIGDGPTKPLVEEVIRHLGVAGAVQLLGRRDDVPDQLRRASCVLQLTHYEGASLAVLEAMAAGIPVVASKVGGMDELVEHGRTGYLVGDDPTEVAAAIRSVWEQPDGGRSLGRAGRARVLGRFTAAGSAASTLDVYDELADSTRTR